VAIVLDFEAARIPAFRQARRAINGEIGRRGFDALDRFDQVALDRYAMRLGDVQALSFLGATATPFTWATFVTAIRPRLRAESRPSIQGQPRSDRH
jgi:hypothetical protein